MKPRHKINTSAPHYHFLLFFLALQKTTMSWNVCHHLLLVYFGL
jgi:hypothetical protein